MDFLISWALWLIFIFVACLFHELGHATMSRILFNDKSWVITMGSGTPIFYSKRLIINAWFFMAGRVRYSVNEGKKSHQIIRAAGGFTVNIVLAILIYLFAILYSSNIYELPVWWPVVSIAFFANIINALITMLPVTYPYGIVKGMPSDGLCILRIIRNSK